MFDGPVHWIDLKADFAFKQLFGQPRGADILMAFLNALLDRQDANRIVALEYLNPELTRTHAAGKEPRLDVNVRTGRGERVNVEVQLVNQRDMSRRTLFYWASLFVSQGRAGMRYTDLDPAIAVNILNFRQFPSTGRYHTAYHIYEQQEKIRLTDALAIHCIELPKWRRARRDNGRSLREQARDPLDRWLLLLDAGEDEEIRRELEEVAMADPVMEQAFNLWAEISRDPENATAYISLQKAIMDEYSLQKDREEALEEREQALRERDEALGTRDKALRTRDEALRTRDEALRTRDEALRDREQVLTKLRQTAIRLLQLGHTVAEAAVVCDLPEPEVQKLVETSGHES